MRSLRVPRTGAPRPAGAGRTRAGTRAPVGWLLAGGLAALGPLFAAPRTDDPLQREFEVRRLALGLEDGAADPGFPAADPAVAWDRRHAWLDALARAERWPGSPDGGAPAADDPTAARVRQALGDPQPNLRVAALEVLAAHPGRVEAPLADLRHDPFPGVRRALAPLAGPELLADLAADPDPEVAEEARRWLFSAGPGAVDAQARALAAAPDALGPALEPLGRHGVAPELAERLREGSGADPRLVDLCAWLAETDDGPRVSRADVELAVLQHARDLDVGAVCRRRARRGDVELGRRLLTRARLSGPHDPEHALPAWFEVGVLCLDPVEAARAGRDLEGAWATELWRVLAGLGHAWRVEDLEPWLSPERPDSLRFDVAQVAARRLERDGEGAEELARLLLGLVDDRAPGLRIASFRWLARSNHLEALQGELRAHWAEQPREARLQRLRDLPRDRALPAFRDDLLALLAEPATRTASVVELLGAYGPGSGGDADASPDAEPDAEVGRALRRVLAGELDAVRAESEGVAALLDTAQLARALGRGFPAASVDLLVDAVEANVARDGRPRWDLLKAAVGGLARSPEGRARLAELVGREDLARRARFEAALFLPEFPAAQAYLRASFEGVDSVLRERAVATLARAEGGDPEAIDDFLEARLLDPAAGLVLRMGCAEALGRRGRGARLARALGRVRDAELRLVLARELVRGGAPDALGVLLAHARLRLLRRDDPLDGEWNLEEALQVLAIAAGVGELPEDLLREALARPLSTARSDLTRRFRRQNPGAPEARFRPELELFRALAARGEAVRALGLAGPWWRLDARLLHALWEAAGPHAAGEPELARLLTAARVALAGEPLTGRDEQLRLRWLSGGPGAGDPDTVAGRLARGLRVADRGLLGRLGLGD